MRSAMLFALILLAGRAQAECQYSNYELTLRLTRTNGEELICYRTMSACNLDLDRLGNEAYLFEVLYNTDITSDILWFRHRAAYRYCTTAGQTCPDEEMAKEYVIFDGIAIDRTAVRRIEVIEHERVGAFDHVSSELQMSDTVLFHKRPIEVIACDGYLCYHRIAVYKRNPKLVAAFDAIRALNAEIAELADDLDHTNGDDYDDRMEQLVAPLRKERGLVIVSGCTD